jgi:NAD(P)-dependent dehydrogenase (short-subunit alcohol dehydrogenase family)
MASNTIVLITGANTGLGLEIVKALWRSSKAYTILLGGRSLDKAKNAVEGVVSLKSDSKSTCSAVQIDIEDDASIEQLTSHIEKSYGKLDVLINNAGKVPPSPHWTWSELNHSGGQFDQEAATGKLSIREMWDKSWRVNTTSTNVVTQNLVPLLLESDEPRLLFITSGTSTLTEQGTTPLPVDKSPPKGWPKQALMIPAYRASKTGLNMAMKEWARLLKEDGVKTWCVSPGFLATGLGGNPDANKKAGGGDPAVGGQFVVDVVEGKRDGDVGKVIRKDNVQPW